MRRAGFAVAVVAMFGCAEPAFSPHLPDNVSLDLEHALSFTRPAPGAPAATAPRPMAFLVTAERGLVGFDLDGNKVAWEVPAQITSRLAVSSELLAHRTGPSTIVVRRRDSGAERCRATLADGEKLLGIAVTGRVYYAVQRGDGVNALRAIVALDGASCQQLWRDEVQGSVGAPAALGELVAVPFLHQDVVLLDGKTGNELARVRSKDDDIAFVRATREGLFYGSNKGVYLVTPRSAGGTRKDTPFASAALRSDKIRSFYSWDGFQPAQLDYTAFDRNRLLWRAAPAGDGVTFQGGLAYLHNYRFLFGFDAASGDVRWAYAHPRVDLVGSEDAGATILFAAVDGELGALDAKTGAVAWHGKVDKKLVGATFDADAFAPGPGTPPGPLPSTLASIVWDPDARFTAVKVYAVDALARSPGTEVSEALLQIVLKPGVPPSVAQRAAEALVARKDTTMAARFREALAQHYDYLDDKQPRAVDVLARAAAAIDDMEAVPLLGAQLLDGATPQAALKEVAQAITSLGGENAIAPLRALLLLYRCDPQFAKDPAPLEAAALGVLKLGGDAGRRVVEFVVEEPRTIAPLAHALAERLHPPATRPAPAPATPPAATR